MINHFIKKFERKIVKYLTHAQRKLSSIAIEKRSLYMYKQALFSKEKTLFLVVLDLSTASSLLVLGKSTHYIYIISFLHIKI